MAGKLGMKHGVRNHIPNMFVNYQRKACERGISFILDHAEFEVFVFDKCYYCDREPYKPNSMTNSTELFVNGVDRWDNSMGYFFSNCVTACTECNFMKGSMDGLDFLALVRRIALNHS